MVAVLGAALASCKPNLTAPDPTAGSLDLTSYVAIGNSLTAGYQDNGLTYKGQKSSYVEILAEQFKLVKPDLVFNSPYIDPASVGCGAPNFSINPAIDPNNLFALLGSTFTVTIAATAPYSMQSLPDCNGVYGLMPAPSASKGDLTVILDPSTPGFDAATQSVRLTFAGSSLIGGFPTIKTAKNIYAEKGPFNNMGVSGARCIDVNKVGYGGDQLINVNLTSLGFAQSNPFFSRFAKDKATSSMLSDAKLLKPTFFSLFIGNNDVLLWASQGGVTGAISTSITPVSEFNDSLDHILDGLMETAKQGIIVNVPQITGAAFFTFMKPDVTKYIVDENGGVRLMTTNDQMLLTVPQDSLKCGLGGFGTSSYPIPKLYTLTANQVAMATAAIDGYNTHIKAEADARGIAFFDMNGFTKANQNGAHYNGMEMSGTFGTGGIFSLDGLHLTPRGYAAAANEMIKEINKKYGSTIPLKDLTKLNGVDFGK